MNVVRGYPPNFREILAVFPQARRSGVIFTYGDTIYCSGPEPLTDSLMAHESVHSAQQGDDPEGWWRRYLTDRQFMFEQELAAHRREYAVAADNGNRHVRRAALKQIAKRLSGPLYGNPVSLADAIRLIEV